MVVHNYAKIIHRDIKPDNLLINETDDLKISDFGISMLYNDSEYLTNEDGTKCFLAPEI